jgi:hypothetical protein
MQNRSAYEPRRREQSACLLAWSLVGCASSISDKEDAPLAQVASSVQPFNVSDANGGYFASVVASGTGCPPGTWNTRVSEDGEVFTTTFGSYFSEVNPNANYTVRDCELEVKFQTPTGRSFTIQTFSYSGYANLQPGVIGTQSATYSFEGTPVSPEESASKRIGGPEGFNDSFMLEHNIPISSQDWTPCGVESRLNIATKVEVLNSTPPSSGYMNLSAMDGRRRLVFQIDSKTCNQGSSVPSPGAVPAATKVQVAPSTVQSDQPFRVTWRAPANAVGATYRVQVRQGADVVWQSASLTDTRFTFDETLAEGRYQVIVVTRIGERESLSSPAQLIVGDAQATPTPTPASGGVPAWAQPLVGRYAMRNYSFTNPTGAMLSGSRLSIAEFVRDGDSLKLITQVCDQRANARGVTVRPRTPEAFPMMTRTVSFDSGQQWSTDGNPVATGYMRENPPQCAGRIGQYVPKGPGKEWIRGSTCRCASPSAAPLADDCRVIDPDGDGHPGLAYVWSGTGVSGNLSHAGVVDRSRLVRGTVNPNGSHFAQYHNDQYTFFFECQPDECEVPAVALPCSSEHNGTQFVRLPEPPSGQRDWTCATLRAAESRLFTTNIPATPSRCNRSELTSAP